jgi:hypothetical protein
LYNTCFPPTTNSHFSLKSSCTDKSTTRSSICLLLYLTIYKCGQHSMNQMVDTTRHDSRYEIHNRKLDQTSGVRVGSVNFLRLFVSAIDKSSWHASSNFVQSIIIVRASTHKLLQIILPTKEDDAADNYTSTVRSLLEESSSLFAYYFK